MPEAEIRQALDQDNLRKYKQRILDYQVSTDTSRAFCSTPDCLGVLTLKSGLGADKTKVTCEDCKKDKCFKCQTDWHQGKTCQQNKADKFYEFNIANGIGYCPKCDAPVEKDGGCPMMHCSRCSYSWCWSCGMRTNNATLHNLFLPLCQLTNDLLASKLRKKWIIFLLILGAFIYMPVLVLLIALILPSAMAYDYYQQ